MVCRNARGLMNWERPPCTERKSLNQECGWKDGDRGGPARTEGIHRKEKRKKRKTHLTHTGLLMEGQRAPLRWFVNLRRRIMTASKPAPAPKMTVPFYGHARQYYSIKSEIDEAF